MTQIIVTTANELENIIHSTIRKVLADQPGKHSVPETPKDQILTVDEAAAFLNLARQTLYGFTSKRIIPFIKKGKKLYFRKSELEKWLFEGKHKTIDELKAEMERSRK